MAIINADGLATAVGCVIRVQTRDTQIMSDVYEYRDWVTYWDAERGEIRDVCLYNETAEVDATPEVLARWAGREAGRAWLMAEHLYNQRERYADLANKGTWAKVGKGARKATPGAIGFVFWEGPYSVGLATSCESQWPTHASLTRLRTTEILKDRDCVLVRFHRDNRYGCAVKTGQGKETRWAVTIATDPRDAIATLPNGHLMSLAVKALGL